MWHLDGGLQMQQLGELGVDRRGPGGGGGGVGGGAAGGPAGGAPRRQPPRAVEPLSERGHQQLQVPLVPRVTTRTEPPTATGQPRAARALKRL